MLVNSVQHYSIEYITGESGLVFRGHIMGGELVAVKTVKGKEQCLIYGQFLSNFNISCSALSSKGDKSKLLKEVSLMLSFKHQNVMSLIGMCLDGDVPLIIMPFMSDGSVLDYVRKNRQHLYLTEESSQERVIICTQACFVLISSYTIITFFNFITGLLI